jgi:hypothetical protein
MQTKPLKKRGDANEEITGPGDLADDQAAVDLAKALKPSEAAKELTKWRDKRDAERDAFNRAVLGEAAPADDETSADDAEPLSFEDQYAKAKTALSELEGELGITSERDQALADAKAKLADLEKLVESQQQAAASTPATVTEQQIAGHVEQQVGAARAQLVNSILERFPEAADQQWLNDVRTSDPARYAEITQAYIEAERILQTVGKSAAMDALQYQSAQQAQFHRTAAQHDQAFAEAHPEMANAKVRQAIFENAYAYLREAEKMSDEEIRDGYFRTGELRSYRAQERILRASRAWAAQRRAPAPRRATPKHQPMRPGSAGEISQAPNRNSDLETRLERSGSVRDAARLLIARRAARRR